MMSLAAKKLVLHEEVWKIIEEEEERPIEASMFSRGEKGPEIVVIPTFDGNKSWRESLDWLYRYSHWANQEGLSDDKALVYAVMHLQGKSRGWGQHFLRSGSWSDFLRCFFELYIPTVDYKWFLQWYRNERKKNQIVWYTAKEISKATNYFSEGNCVREDKLGKIYRGCLPGTSTGETNNSSNQFFTVRKYRKEVKTEALLHVIRETRNNRDVLAFAHPNVLKLLGFAFSERVPLLLYDLPSNGTLEQHLLNKTDELYWGTRLTIAIDVADAIRHLHSSNYSRTTVCRHHVVTSNILLDSDYRAKLAEFDVGDSSSMQEQPPRSPPKSGFIDQLRLKAAAAAANGNKDTDVYKYGVVLMELVSGRKAWVSEVPSDLFPDLWQMKREAGRLDDILDPYLKTAGSASWDSFQEVIFLAVKCCSMRVDMKQTMATVATELRGILRRGVIAEIDRVSKLWKEAIYGTQPQGLESCMKLVDRLERVIDHPSLKSDIGRRLDPFKSLKTSLFDELRVKEGVYERNDASIATPPAPAPQQRYQLNLTASINNRRSGLDGMVTPRSSFFDGPMSRAPPSQFTTEMSVKLRQLL
ncbi:hypothetical protein R1flu_007258 [Riccia fluitans]|uniref:Protein kinase domain-containing protein n=1 Tax=Riccia fluitans TaxID=41844 RepID=A0ABD1YYC4_9MARC